MSERPLAIMILAHLAIVSFYLFDLFTKSRRKNKPGWAVFILFIPIIGIVIYNATKKRRKI